jgi:hypothetical protein
MTLWDDLRLSVILVNSLYICAISHFDFVVHF